MKKLATLLISAVLAAGSATVFAHSGGTDQFGCHIDHSTGIRHCHP